MRLEKEVKLPASLRDLGAAAAKYFPVAMFFSLYALFQGANPPLLGSPI